MSTVSQYSTTPTSSSKLTIPGLTLTTVSLFILTSIQSEIRGYYDYSYILTIITGFYERVVAYKKRGVKVSLALGGWNDSAGDKYSRLVNNPAARKRFVEHALQFVEKYGFDGLDLDWEYPVCWQVCIFLYTYHKVILITNSTVCKSICLNLFYPNPDRLQEGSRLRQGRFLRPSSRTE